MAPHTTLIRGSRCALVDTHEKFRQLYLDTLSNLINPAEIDYLIISHTEPDHSGLVKDILQLAPSHSCRVKARQFLEDMVHQPFKQQIVKWRSLRFGQWTLLEFVSAPNLHWLIPCSATCKTQILYTCDAFGCTIATIIPLTKT